MDSKEVGDQITQLYSSILMRPRATAKELDQPGGVARKPLSTSLARSVHEPV